DIPGFVTEMNRRCTRDDPLYPLLDFVNQSHEKIAAMQFKRYNNDDYRAARDRSACGRRDPSLREIVSGIMTYMLTRGLISPTTRMTSGSEHPIADRCCAASSISPVSPRRGI